MRGEGMRRRKMRGRRRRKRRMPLLAPRVMRRMGPVRRPPCRMRVVRRNQP